MGRTGAQYFVEFLHQSGVEYLFGNPGTTELPINDALLDSPVRYILALQEIPAVAMADGYAQARGSVALVNLHISCGLGNAMGMLYNAFRAGTPLVLTAGQQDQRFLHSDPILWGDMVSVTRPWTKWSTEVRTARELPRILRRAIQLAQTPPTGPVFLSLPLDVQTAQLPEAAIEPPANPPALPVLPPAEAIRSAAERLAAARNPAIVLGSKPLKTPGIQAVCAIAERLGAPVFHEPYYSHGRCNFPAGHPLAGGLLPFWAPDIRRFLGQFDVLLAVGVKLFEEYIYHGDVAAVPESMCLVQVDNDPAEINKNYRTAIGLVGILPEVLMALARELENLSIDEGLVQGRSQNWRDCIAASRRKLRSQAQAELQLQPMTPLAMLETLARVLPPNAAVVEEAPTTSGSYFERVGLLPTTEGFFAQRGWALGWGLGFAVGVRLAWPDRPVLALLGDGAALYGIQGLWTAAHYRIPVTFVVANNHQYAILKDCGQVLRLPGALQGRYEGLDLVEPNIDYVKLAEAFGVQATRVDSAEGLAESVTQAFRAEEPTLIEVPVTGSRLEVGSP